MIIKPKNLKNNSIKNKPQCVTVQSLDELDSKLLFSVCVQDCRTNLGQSTIDDCINAYRFIQDLTRNKYYEDWFKSDLEELADTHLPFKWEEISDAFKNKSPNITKEHILSRLKNESWYINFEYNYINFMPFTVQFLDINNIEEVVQSILNPKYILSNNELELDIDAYNESLKGAQQRLQIVRLNTKIIYKEPKTNSVNDPAKQENAYSMSISHSTGIELLAGFSEQNFFNNPTNDFQQYLASCAHHTESSYRNMAKNYCSVLGETIWKIPKDLFCHIRYFSDLNNVANSLVGINRTLYGHPND
nr:MAG: aminopeptidase N-like protein [Enquatrovirus sp.]